MSRLFSQNNKMTAPADVLDTLTKQILNSGKPQEEKEEVKSEASDKVEELPPIPEVQDDDTESEVSNLQEEVAKISAPKQVNKFKTKAQIIEQIEKITPGEHSKRKLQRMRKADLEELLGTTFNTRVHEVFEGSDCGSEDSMEKPNKHFPQVNGLQICELLYGFTCATVTGIERLTQSYKHKLGGFYLNGWRENIEANEPLRDMLKQSLYEVFQENSAAIMPYLTSSGRVYSILMITMLSSVRRQ